MNKRNIGNQSKLILNLRIGKFYIQIGKIEEEYTTLSEVLEGVKEIRREKTK